MDGIGLSEFAMIVSTGVPTPDAVDNRLITNVENCTFRNYQRKGVQMTEAHENTEFGTMTRFRDCKWSGGEDSHFFVDDSTKNTSIMVVDPGRNLVMAKDTGCATQSPSRSGTPASSSRCGSEPRLAGTGARQVSSRRPRLGAPPTHSHNVRRLFRAISDVKPQAQPRDGAMR